MHRLLPRTFSTAARLGALLTLALLAGCAQTPPASPQEDAQAQATPGEPVRPAFDIEVRAPDRLATLLRDNLSLRRYREVGDLEEVELERLVALAEQEVRRLLAAQGYFTPEVSIRLERQAEPTRVIVAVQPGEAATVSDVEMAFEGDIATSDAPKAQELRAAIREEWALRTGERFTQEEWDRSKREAVQQLVAVRYPRGRISYSIAAVNAEAARAHLGLRLDSGPLFRLGPIVVTGAERYPPLVAERLARLPLGGVYSRQDIIDAQLRLTGSGYYDTAFLYVDPQSDPDAAPVQVNVRESPLQRWVLGLGLTTDLGPHASVEYRRNRFPNAFWRTDARLQIEEKNPLAEVQLLSIPNPDGWRWGGLARVSRVLDDDGQDTRALRLRAGRSRVEDHISREAYLQLDRASVRDRTDTLPAVERGEGSALTANYVAAWRYFDSPTSPTRGWGIAAELGAGITLSGPRRPFQRTVLRWENYVPFEPSRLKVRTEAGAVFAADDAEIPSTQLFRTGGDTTVRGYGFREIGVTRANGVDAPGRYLLVGSAEWIRPIRLRGEPTSFEHTFFVDAGAVADRPSELDPVFGVGTGVRYVSPIGPLQASIAYGLESRRLRLHLTVGVTFQ
ncbi:BamA/TamA family outer membrane protein [Ramlibacter sp. AN1015]|uniref:autotransporter assembly complex protein TamA n=1 Tax=Ramlibacter sp. AN1015 TaxID=3133428 RepID=UPI0030C03DFE